MKVWKSEGCKCIQAIIWFLNRKIITLKILSLSVSGKLFSLKIAGI